MQCMWALLLPERHEGGCLMWACRGGAASLDHLLNGHFTTPQHITLQCAHMTSGHTQAMAMHLQSMRDRSHELSR